MLIRKALELDAKKIIEVMQDAEASGFMLYEPNERNIAPESLSKFIASMNAAPKSGFFIAEVDGTILGYLLLKSENLARTSHRATIAIGVHSSSRGKGVGTQLFDYISDYAKAQQLHRLELTVIENNDQAVHLYKKMGFEVEGVKRDSLLIKGQFANEYYMSKLL